MPLGTALQGQPAQQQMAPALAQSMNPQAVAQGGQPNQANGIGGQLGNIFQRLQQNPAAIQMLLQSGAQLLNPTTFQGPAGRISQAISDGVSGYETMKTTAADKLYAKEQNERQQDRADRQVGQGDRKLEQGDRQIELTEKSMDIESDQWVKTFGLKEEELSAQRELWKAQAARWGAESRALAEKARSGQLDSLTGPERIINNFASIFAEAGVDPARAYTMGFDIYNKSSEGKAKAITSAYESMGMLGTTDKGKALLENVINEIETSFSSGTDVLDQTRAQRGQQPQPQQQSLEVAPGVGMTDVQQALDAINRNDGTQLQWDTLNDQHKDRLIQVIQQRKGGGQ